MRLPAVPVHSFEDATLNAEALQALLTLPAWTAPTLINSWANLGGAFETAGYLKDGFGVVRLKGLITGGVTATNAFVLPAGYRPGAEGQYVIQGGYVLIFANGSVNLNFAAGANFPLSGITFRAEN